jgi:hypothetical protein
MSLATLPELRLLAALLLLAGGFPGRSAAQQQSAQDAPPFHIVVLEGEGSINNIHQNVNRGATVLVEDENKNPLSGVAVSFFLPNEGPSGMFPNASKVLTVFTDDKGTASSRTVHFNNLVGLMRMRVTASLFSQTAASVITQTNVAAGAAMKTGFVPATGMAKVAKPSSGSHKKLIVLLVVVAAAGAGAYFMTHKSTPAASIGAGQTTAGTATIGGPQ